MLVIDVFARFSANHDVHLPEKTQFFFIICLKINFPSTLVVSIYKNFLGAPPPDPRQGATAPWTPIFAPPHTALACVRGCEVGKMQIFFDDSPPWENARHAPV